MFSNNVQYKIKNPLKVLLIINEERQLPEVVLMDRDLNVSIGRKLIPTPPDGNANIIKTDKFACMCHRDGSLPGQTRQHTDNLEDARLSNILLRHNVANSEEFRDRPLSFYQGVTIFGTCRQFFWKNSAFQTIFSLHFVMETIFYNHF